jgi:two-component system sensor histidine kinase CpxA
MRSLIFKMFLCYWIAAGFVIVISGIGPHQQIHRPEATVALAAALHLDGVNLIRAYEAGGCPQLKPLLAQQGDHIYLSTAKGNVICENPPVDNLPQIVSGVTATNVAATNFRTFQIIAIPTKSSGGQPYLVILQSHFTSPLDYYGIAVGPTTMWISAGVTILLGVFIALPIRKVRSAARAVANGRLDTRVHLGWAYKLIPRLVKEDVLTGLADDFNHMADQLESLAESQRTLFRDISHELRSPLARLNVALELARQASPPSMISPLDRIKNEASRVNDLTGQMLTLSHMETMQDLHQKTELSLRDLIECLLPDLEYEAVGRQRTLRTHDLQECVVCGDVVMLQRAVENVVRNAICHTPERGIVEIELKEIWRNGSGLGVLKIIDDGPGVPKGELQSILRPFYRSDKTRQPSTGGFGVGLAIANRAVKLHEGEIAISNKPEGGLIVEMSFPLVRNQPILQF